MAQVSAEPPRKVGSTRLAKSARYARPVPHDQDREIDELQALLDAVPPPLDPLDVSSLDGFLCGVIVQPRRIDRERWLPLVTDVDGRPLPPGFDARRLHSLVDRREAELRRAIERREWFDPRVFELAGGDESKDEADDGDAVYPWVAGFAAAMESFPALIADGDDSAVLEPLALIYRHLVADDLEDADALLAEIESLEPPVDLAESVEGIVRATLLLADAGRERSRR
ncbi:MAG: YecA family protein [Caldimonas sp.]